MKGKLLSMDKLNVSTKRKKFQVENESKNSVNNDIKIDKKMKKKRKNDIHEKTCTSEKKAKLEEVKESTNQNTTESAIEKENSDATDHEELEVEVSKEESDKFNGKFLRNAFNSAAGFSTLQKFITLCSQNNKKDLAAEYLQAGGSVLEILRLLDSSEKKNINNASTVFAAMHIAIMKILAQYPQMQSSAEEACRHLINTHLASIHLMLSAQSKPKNRKIVLKLLAAVVSLGGTLPRELLNHLSFHSQLLEVLVTHSKPTDPQSVRTCFIHFILAFLIDGTASDVRALLEKRGVLSSIFAGLTYDYSNVVQLVLTTVKKYILENPIITKTTKLHVFSTPVVQGLVNLYNWKGPKNWPGHKKQKLLTENIDPEEKEITVSAIHEFLITLLTSKKYGIVFQDKSLGTDSGKHNQLINTILQSLDKPWEHEKPAELIVKILTACPDLIKSQLIYTEPFLVPRVSKKWISVMQFIKRIINDVDVDNCLKLCSSDMTIMQMANAISNLTIPPIVMRNAVIPSLEHKSPIINYETISLVLIMIKKIESFIKAFEHSKFNSSEISTFKNLLLEYVLKHMPSFDCILNIWVQALSHESDDQSADAEEKDIHVEIKDRLLIIINLLQAYSEICPEILLTSGTANLEQKPTILLTTLAGIPAIDEEELTFMKVKALKILLCSNLSEFTPNEEIFSVSLSFLITKVGDKNVSFDSEVRQTLSLLLNGCGVFEGFNDQIEIWINSITHLDGIDDKLEVASYVGKIIKRIYKHTEKYLSLIHKIEENTGEEEMDISRQEDIFNQLSERNIEDVKLLSAMLPVTAISLPVYAAVETLKKTSSEALAHYLSVVFTHTLHCQVSSKAFLTLIEGLHIPGQKYFICWLNCDSPALLKKPFESKNIFRMVSKLLLGSDKICKVYTEEMQLCMQLNDETFSFVLTNFKVKGLVQMVIFYFTQSLQKSDVELPTTVVTDILITLLTIAKDMSTDIEDLFKDCAKYIFKHPVLLQYFEGISKNKTSKENTVTTLFIKICMLFSNSQKQSYILQHIRPFEEKFIMQIKSAVKKIKSKEIKKELNIHIELIECLHLNMTLSIDLLAAIMILPKEKFVKSDKSTLSVWAVMIPKLVDRCFTGEIRNEQGLFITLPENLLKKIFSYLTELKLVYKQEMDSWEISLFKYLFKFPHSISTIDEKIFTTLLKTNIAPTTFNIINLLIERNPKLITAFVKYANINENIFEQKSLIFSILSNSLKHKWDQEFLNKVYNACKIDITNFLTEPKEDGFVWIKENVDAAAYLIEHTFDATSCKEICDTVLSNGNKLDAVQEENLKLLQTVFKKSTEIKADALKDFVQVLVHITVTALKKDSKNITKLNFFCKTLIDSISILKSDVNFTFEELSKNYSWPQFTRINLKSGLKIKKEDKCSTSFLLKALVATCDVAYKDNTNEEYAKTIFEMTTSHSEFINIMLSNASIKSDLVELLWILVKKNHTVMLATHVPLYLAAYNATLSTSDQFILKILQHYENNGIKLDEYRPYLWGSAAASHYSVKGETDTALWRQPSISQVLDLLVPEIVNNTIKNFPVKRNWQCNFTKEQVNLDQIYDPAFYLSVFTHILAEYNVVPCHKVIHSGALALIISACSSTFEEVRLAAFIAISRFYFHLEATSSKEKLLWINFIDTLRNGIKQTESPLRNIRLNGFVSTFLSRSSLVISQPLNQLYSPLQAFLMAKPALDLNTIPEFLQLYHSSEIEHKSHRHWILEVIRDGLEIDSDMDVALKCVLFKMLFDFYTSTLSDNLSKTFILQIINSVTKLPKACMLLVNGYGLLPWLITVTERLRRGDVQPIICTIDIVNNILNSFHETKTKETYHHLMLMKVLLKIKTYFNQNITEEYLKTYINIVNKTIINNIVGSALTKDHLKDIVIFAKQLLHDVSVCEIMLQFGCKFVNKRNLELDKDGSTQESLCKLIEIWYSYVKNAK
ncbi:nucleolar pre-ribosomal-associated protein 1 [Nasonia vitripennis]|uniref:Nucleolar pre-ribosomal-associated protein 1 n=1 Tax=Nasonia vitripennis TaxID=7425 RepID=A0A7M7H5P3_NASVI|nr:nucleolar pre-ribosomal-associated protein 1 [Nasonia vitripennis]